MDRLDCLETFAHVYESGSFSAAARRQGTTQPTVSKRIAWLEEHFGASLFMRSTRRLTPTEEAGRIYEHARKLLESYELTRASIHNALPEPAGTLTIAAPSSFGRHILMPLAAEFLRLYPDISLDLRMSERQINMLEEGAELALRIGELKDSSLRMRPLGRISRFAVASPLYLKNHPAPKEPGELAEHLCIGYSRFGLTTNWVFESEYGRHLVDIECALRVDDADMLQAAVLEGMGIAILPGWLALPHLEAGEMEIILPDFIVPGLPLNAIYPDPGTLSLRARSFLDFLAENKKLLA
ncbi:MAG: LysR family transcriptional regulator [Gammaproteobacteria bacterium]|nr:LysR family transcriptional regulator [Gammaproteobacteria bacterium]MAY03520.1 LysR family transcriptional regulator [Gammaproteobacteria bacterium]|tara:strand:- start:308919 stop:309809 length:891 start_codon:yes stop_codon:yes gene_type:complete